MSLLTPSVLIQNYELKVSNEFRGPGSKFQKETPCAFTALYNLSPFMKNILRMGRPFVPFEYIFCNTLNESLDKIYEFKEGKHAKLTKDYEKRIYTQKQIDEYSAELLDKIKDINWDNAINGQINSISQTEQEKQLESLSKDNPLQLVFEAISILKMDIAHAIYDKSEVEKKLFLANKLSTLGEVAAGVGHEINNPLTIMLGFCSNLLEKIQKDPNAIAPHEIKLTLEKIASAGQRIKQIVGSLKMHSRKNGDDHNLFSLMQSLDETTKLSNILFANASISFKIEISPKAQEFYSQINIMGDKVKFQQVLFNFFNNAKDAIIEKKEEQGLIKIIIDKNTSSNQSEQSVFIHISDNGIGIPQENFSKIFDAFYTTKPIGRGTGLGLSIAHSIITEMNGNLEFTSVVGEGSIFKISLPYQLG